MKTYEERKREIAKQNDLLALIGNIANSTRDNKRWLELEAEFHEEDLKLDRMLAEHNAAFLAEQEQN